MTSTRSAKNIKRLPRLIVADESETCYACFWDKIGYALAKAAGKVEEFRPACARHRLEYR